MKYLLDTHAFLFAAADPSKLSRRARLVIEDRGMELLVSAASAWEVSTKYRIGRLPAGASLVAGWTDHVQRLGAHELPISSTHALLAGSFTTDHRDPFDRMLAAQAVAENATLLTDDPMLSHFPVKAQW